MLFFILRKLVLGKTVELFRLFNTLNTRYKDKLKLINNETVYLHS